MDGITFNFSPSVALLYNIFVVNAPTANLNIIANVNGVDPDSVDYIEFIPRKNCILYGRVDTDKIIATIFDEYGNVDKNFSPFNNTTRAVIGNFIADKKYLLQIKNIDDPINSLNLAINLVSAIKIVLSMYFPNGFINQVPSNANPSFIKNADGSITYFFNNYNAIKGQSLLLCSAQFAIASLDSESEGVYITCTDSSFQNNQIFPFTVGQSVNIFFKPLKTGIFNGQINVTLTNLNQTNFLNFIPVLPSNY
jgi:hypothetical protein